VATLWLLAALGLFLVDRALTHGGPIYKRNGQIVPPFLCRAADTSLARRARRWSKRGLAIERSPRGQTASIALYFSGPARAGIVVAGMAALAAMSYGRPLASSHERNGRS
jgi:hypothetical protein